MLAPEVVFQGSADIQPMLDTTEAGQNTPKMATAVSCLCPRPRAVVLDQPDTGVRQLHIFNDYKC